MGKNNIATDNFKYFYKSRSLPHMFDTNKPVFMTFRLKFTIPKSIVAELISRKTEWNNHLETLKSSEKENERKRREYKLFVWFDELIAHSEEIPNLLNNTICRDIVSHALHFHDDLRYQLLAYCIMPNHVHIMFVPLVQADNKIFPISHISYTWKKYTATRLNKYLQKKGSFWQSESYDHLIRNEQELFLYLEYVMENPVKAGLADMWSDWQGTWIREDLKPD